MMINRRFVLLASVFTGLFVAVSLTFAAPRAQTTPCLMDFVMPTQGGALMFPRTTTNFYFPGNQWVSIPAPDHYYLALDWSISGSFSDGDSITLYMWVTFDGGSTFDWYALTQFHPADDLPVVISLPEGAGYRGLRVNVYSPDAGDCSSGECIGNFSVNLSRAYVYQSTGCSTSTPTNTATLVPWPGTVTPTPTSTALPTVEICSTTVYTFDGSISPFIDNVGGTDCHGAEADRGFSYGAGTSHTADGSGSAFWNDNDATGALLDAAMYLPDQDLASDLALPTPLVIGNLEVDVWEKGWQTFQVRFEGDAGACDTYSENVSGDTWNNWSPAVTPSAGVTQSLVNLWFRGANSNSYTGQWRADDISVSYCYDVTVTPLPTPTATNTGVPTSSPTPTETPTPENDVTATAQATNATATAAAWTSTPTETSTATATPTETSTPGNDATATAQATNATATAAAWTPTPSSPGGGGGDEGLGVTGVLTYAGGLGDEDLCIPQDLQPYQFYCSAENVPAFSDSGWYRWLSGHAWFLFCNFSERLTPIDELVSLSQVPVLAGGYALCQVNRVGEGVLAVQEDTVGNVTAFYSVTQQIMISEANDFDSCTTLQTHLSTDSVPDIGCEVSTVYCAVELFLISSVYLYPVWETLIMFATAMLLISGVKSIVYGAIVTPWSLTRFDKGDQRD